MRVGLKLLLIGVLLLVLVVPLALLSDLVQERRQRGAEVADDIARSSSRAQTLTGPLLLLEYEQLLRTTRDVQTATGTEKVIEDIRERTFEFVAPERLSIDNRLSARERRRGLFGVLLYTDVFSLEAGFSLPPERALGDTLLEHELRSARVVLGVGDSRGIQQLELRADEQDLRAEPGSGVAWLGEGIHALLPLDRFVPGTRFTLVAEGELIGTQSIEWTPLAEESQVTAQADWPHPGFIGQRLPIDPKIDDTGFRAGWRLSRLSSQGVHQLTGCSIGNAQCSALSGASFGVRLVDPVDRYLKTERAMKYALLFLVLVFGAVFFLEALRGVAVHPLQYGLTGLALAMFYLLLLSLSEHVGFGAAYAIAAAGCVALIGTYLQAVLGGRRRGLLFAGLLSPLYAVLYGLLQSEDYALLMGAVVLFALLAGVMLATRRLDWRSVGRPASPT